MAFNTGNALGSTDPRDLSDNAENFDRFANGDASAYDDRLGVSRKSISGMESEFASDQSERATTFANFLASSGYVGTGTGGAIEDYAGGIEITEYNQLIRESGEFYRAKASLSLPYTTTGTWVGDDETRFVSVGDAALRQEIGSGIFRADSLATLESTPGRFNGDAARLVSGTGRDGDFRWDSSDLSATLVLASATSDSVDDTTDTINDADHPFSDGDGVITQTTVNGLTAQTVYWVVNSTSGTYQLSATFGGGAVDLTGTTNVTIDKLLDPLQGVYVTPTADKTGGGGAWVREGVRESKISTVDVSWFGADLSSDVAPYIVSAAVVGDTVMINPPAGSSYLYNSNEPIKAKAGLSIIGPGKDRVSITMGGNSLYGGYQFITQDGAVSGVTIRGIGFDGQNIKPGTISPVNDGEDGAIPAQLIDLSGCSDVTIDDVKVFQWHHYYNLDDAPCIINVSDCTNPTIRGLVTKDCFGEQIEARNTINGTFKSGKCTNSLGGGASGGMFTALNQFPSNALNDVTTSYNNIVEDWFVDGATGTAIDIGGVGVFASNIRWINCAKGIHLSNEQFPGSPNGDHDNILISKVYGVCDGTSGGYGVYVAARVAGLTMSDIQVSGSNGSGIRVDSVKSLAGSNWIARDCIGDTSILVDGYVDGSSVKHGVCTLSNVYSSGYNGVSGFSVRSFRRAKISDLIVSDTNVSLTPNDRLKISGLTVEDYEPYANYGMRLLTGAHGKITISDFEFIPDTSGATTFTFSHISAAAGTTIESAILVDGDFGYTSDAYSVELSGLSKMKHANVSHESLLLIFMSSYDATLTATENSGVNTWRTPIFMGNGYLWVDSTGDLRIKTTYPASDTDGVVVGSQS